VITEYGTPTPGSIPARMTAGPDGNMWFTENGASQIGSINPGTGVITEYSIPTPNSAPVGIITGPDHNIWFTENGADKIGQLAVVLPTTTTLGSSSNPSVAGTPITLTASVTPASATGTVTFFDGTTNLGTGTVASGSATLVTAALGVGSQSLTAVYGGDNFNTTSTSAPLVQVVQAVTSTGLQSNDNPANYGDLVTLTATVTPSSATGTVTFYDGTTSLGTGTLNSSGITTLQTSALAAGGHSITADYGGDTLDASSTSATLSEQVNQLATTTGVVSNNNPSTDGQPVIFTATVTPSTATGTVTFYDGTTSLGTGTLGSGTATLTTSSLAVGAHSISATYGGDADDATSTSSTLSQGVNPGNTTTSVATNDSPSTYGDPVTFTATVTPPTATGTVTFYDGITSLGTGTLASSTAALTTSALSGGTHSITAVYGGDSNDSGSSSSALNQVVNQVATTTGLGSNENPSNFGDSVTFTATVLPSTATGNVTFYDGTTALATEPLSTGTAALTTADLSAGAHDITATYNADTNDAASTSSTTVQQVNELTTTTGVVSGPNPSQSGQSVTFTATVAPASATGAVTFYDGANSLGTGTLSLGTATFATSALSIGSHSITAAYGGDANDTGSTSSVLTQVVQAVSATGLGSSPNPSVFGQSVTLTATVTPSTASGTVTFYDGTNSLGVATLSGGTATLTTAALAVGGHNLSAVYSGDAGDTTSTSSVVAQTVNQIISSTALASSPNPSNTGQLVTFTAIVTPSTATGTVTFADGTLPIGTVALVSGVGSFPITTLTSGSHSITAVYSGDANDLGSTSSALTQNVNSNATTTTLTSSANPAQVGTKITFTATVTPSSATGAVIFRSGKTKLGRVALVNGVATFSTTTLSLGTQRITATYSGNSLLAGSKTRLTQKVKKKLKVVPLDSPLSSSAQTMSGDLIGRRLEAGSY
jgi:hypothetical protein